MRNKKGNIFTSERFILFVIIVNAVVIFLQESGVSTPFVNILDAVCTVIFLIEMICKQVDMGMKKYWTNSWNIMDGTLVLLSIPSLIAYFVPNALSSLSMLLILRILRVFRFFRVVHIFPNFGQIMSNLWKALKDSLPIFAGFLVLIIISALFSCALFKNAAPQYFGTPLDSIYSTFRLCTVEGWYEIPDTLAQTLSQNQIVWVRIYFVIILLSGGIIGLSLVNSIFVDAMVSDNNDELEQEVKTLSGKIDELKEEIKKQSRENVE